MIPGAVSRMVEGSAHVPSAGVLTLRGGEIFRISTAGTYNIIHPPISRNVNQSIWFVPTVAGVILGTSGNIAVGITCAIDRVVNLVWLKSTQKWYIESGV